MKPRRRWTTPDSDLLPGHDLPWDFVCRHTDRHLTDLAEVHHKQRLMGRGRSKA